MLGGFLGICKICEKKIESIIFLGSQPIANAFLTPGNFSTEYFYDLTAGFCENCYLLQLTNHPEQEKLFHSNYAFFSGSSKGMSVHFSRLAEELIREFLAKKHDPFVVELGVNDGTLLKNIEQMHFRHLGIDPSSKVLDVACEKGVRVKKCFFSYQTAIELRREYGPVDLIVATNTICHIADLNNAFQGIDHLLKDDGVFIFEEPYVGDMLRLTSYDQIYDEHIYMFSLLSISKLAAAHQLELFDAQPQSVHGGSMRYYLARKNKRSPTKNVASLIRNEYRKKIDQINSYFDFFKSCERSKSELIKLLHGIKASGGKIFSYGATSKSTTIFNYCQIGSDLISYISDTLPNKIGRYSPGMHIPIISQEEASHRDEGYIFLSAWNHAGEIFGNEKARVESGCQWIMHVPKVRMYNQTLLSKTSLQQVVYG